LARTIAQPEEIGEPTKPGVGRQVKCPIRWRGEIGMRSLTEEEQEAWRRLAGEIGAEFEIPESLEQMRVVAKVRQWTITLDTEERSSSGGEHTSGFTYTGTRMRAAYVARDRFWFSITNRGGCLGCLTGCLFFWLRWWKGYDIKIGDPEFDRDFRINGNDKSKVLALLANWRIRQLVQSQPSIELSVTPSLKLPFQETLPQRVFLLYFKERDVITDVERLKSLFELFEEILNQLTHMGSASEEEINLESMSGLQRRWIE